MPAPSRGMSGLRPSSRSWYQEWLSRVFQGSDRLVHRRIARPEHHVGLLRQVAADDPAEAAEERARDRGVVLERVGEELRVAVVGDPIRVEVVEQVDLAAEEQELPAPRHLLPEELVHDGALAEDRGVQRVDGADVPREGLLRRVVVQARRAERVPAHEALPDRREVLAAPEVEELPVAHDPPGEGPEVLLARDHAARVLVEEVEIDVEADAPVQELLLPGVHQVAEPVPLRVHRADDLPARAFAHRGAACASGAARSGPPHALGLRHRRGFAHRPRQYGLPARTISTATISC